MSLPQDKTRFGSEKSRHHELWLVAVQALLLLLLSWLTIQAGIALGVRALPPDLQYANPADAKPDLFRFDAVFYREIAEWGYAYDGNPRGDPNIVFAPLFPLLARSFAVVTDLDLVSAGFVINKCLFASALFFWLLYLRTQVSSKNAFFAMLLLATCAGSYAFHAFYSEATLFFLLGLCFWSHSQGKDRLAATCSAALGASRLTAFPVVCVVAGYFIWQAWRGRARQRSVLGNVLLALLCLSGTAAYLGHIGHRFGNPFTLLQAVQQASWGRFHPEVSWLRLLTGTYFLEYGWLALHRGWQTFLDIRSINLAWMLLGLGACIHLIASQRRSLYTLAFVSYFCLIYWSGASSEYLISSHRFFALMPPIFMMFVSLCETITRRWGRIAAALTGGSLILVNLIYGVLVTAAFNQGMWPYF